MPEFLMRRVGPLATWQWAGIGVGAFVFLKWWKARSAAPSSATPTSANYSATVPSDFAEPTATYTSPGGASYSGPLSGLQALLPTGALSSTNSSTSGDTNPTQVSTPPAPINQTALPPVNASNFPQIVPYGSYSPTDYTQIGTVSGGQYSGLQVSGGVPVYTNIFGGFAQGPFPKQGTYGVYIPSQFTQYEHS